MHALDRITQLPLQALVVLVRRQIEAVEARMAAREAVGVPALLDREPPRPVGALQVLEAVHGHARRARRELQQARLALRRPRPEALPEPLDHLVRLLVPAVVGELCPVVPGGAGSASAKPSGARERVRTCRSRTSRR